MIAKGASGPRTMRTRRGGAEDSPAGKRQCLPGEVGEFTESGKHQRPSAHAASVPASPGSPARSPGLPRPSRWHTAPAPSHPVPAAPEPGGAQHPPSTVLLPVHWAVQLLPLPPSREIHLRPQAGARQDIWEKKSIFGSWEVGHSKSTCLHSCLLSS